jgi:hypothetical protein
MYYLLHSITPAATTNNHGRRNCRIFFLGSLLYITLFVIFRNIQLYTGCTEPCETLCLGLKLLFIADVITMAIQYRLFFGRSIVHELSANQKKWQYDETTHQYHQPSYRELRRIKRTMAILRQKEKVRAARLIQHWWRDILYRPGDGKWFKKAEEHFNAMVNT